MSSKYHTRKGYEQLYGYLLGLYGDKVNYESIKKLTSFELLGFINMELIKHNCILFSYDEISIIKRQLTNAQPKE